LLNSLGSDTVRTPSNNNTSTTPYGIFIGISVGGIAIVAAIALAIYAAVRRRRRIVVKNAPTVITPSSNTPTVLQKLTVPTLDLKRFTKTNSLTATPTDSIAMMNDTFVDETKSLSDSIKPVNIKPKMRVAFTFGASTANELAPPPPPEPYVVPNALHFYTQASNRKYVNSESPPPPPDSDTQPLPPLPRTQFVPLGSQTLTRRPSMSDVDKHHGRRPISDIRTNPVLIERNRSQSDPPMVSASKGFIRQGSMTKAIPSTRQVYHPTLNTTNNTSSSPPPPPPPPPPPSSQFEAIRAQFSSTKSNRSTVMPKVEE